MYSFDILARHNISPLSTLSNANYYQIVICFLFLLLNSQITHLTVVTGIIEGFGGKRALGFLLKSELCQKRSKFRMQFCLRVKQCSACFFPEVCFLF